jgi:hypothetical protein
MILNIIGNGFDLYHGLPSSYYFFGCFLINNDWEFYEEIGEMYNLNFRKMIGPSITYEYEYVVDDIFWKDFEMCLGNVQENFIIDKYDDDLGLENDYFTEIEMDEYRISDYLKSYFANWIKKTLDVESNYKLIVNNINSLENKLKFEGEEYFIQFNYTHTLQRIYRIENKKIHYMHGECTENNGEELVVGHGNNSRIYDIKSKICKLEKNFDYTQKMKNDIDEHRCLLKYIEELRKDVESCKNISNNFYKKIKRDISHIKVFGMSLSEVDIPYILDIKHRWPNATWEFSYYSENEINRIEKIALNKLGLDKNKFKIFKFYNVKANDIQNKIIQLQKIKTW